MKKSNIFKIIAILLILIGIYIFFLPKITDLQYNQETQKIKEDFIDQIERRKKLDIESETEIEREKEPFQELYEELKRRNEDLYKNSQKDLKDPFSYEQPDINLKNYGLEGNIIGFISIPKMNIELPILLGANSQNMKKGAVHLTQTSYPIGGENTNSVIAAHRGYSRTAMFRDIQKLKIGDKVYIRNFKELLTYEVCQTKIIKPTDINELLIQKDKDLVTLITCHPYTKNYQRYVVYCQRI